MFFLYGKNEIKWSETLKWYIAEEEKLYTVERLCSGNLGNKIDLLKIIKKVYLWRTCDIKKEIKMNVSL